MNEPTPPVKRHGCFFYGCITSLILLLVVGLAIFFAVRYAIHRVNAAIAQYTDTQPMTLASEPMSPAELDAVKQRLDYFQKGLQAHSNMPPLVLTGPEINGWLAGTATMKDFKNHFHVALTSNQIRGEISLPLDKFQNQSPVFNWFDFKGRYLNGAGVFKVALASNQLSVVIDSLEVKGQPLPETFMSQIRGQNFAANAQNDPTNAAAISRFESIVIQDGKVIITPKQAEAQ